MMGFSEMFVMVSPASLMGINVGQIVFGVLVDVAVPGVVVDGDVGCAANCRAACAISRIIFY